ncbi:prephenate dehydrogenase [Patescibacteria group bacterium]|nr:prephenate dehydrogenase [Patescibacteria group bacterium]
MKNNFPEKIAIIGVGLIGGSISLGLKRQLGSKITVYGICSSPNRTTQAQKSGIIDRKIDAIHKLPKDISLIILSTPINKIVDFIGKINLSLLPKDCLIIDTGSTKEIICSKAKKRFAGLQRFIGNHPMAGKEQNGFENADPYLFRNKPWIICPDEKSRKADILLCRKIALHLGAHTLIMKPETHDRVAALVSHLPSAVASILTISITDNSAWNKETKNIASTGFRDTSRLASLSPEIKCDILFSNRKNVVSSLENFGRHINIFTMLLKMGKRKQLSDLLANAKLERDRWLSDYFEKI